MKAISFITCISCGAKHAVVKEEPNYNGYRGICQNCQGNWPES